MSSSSTVGFEFEFDLPDFEDSDIHVFLVGNSLQVKAYKSVEKQVSRNGFVSDEQTQRSFYYSTSLDGLDSKEFKRVFSKGKLKIIVF